MNEQSLLEQYSPELLTLNNEIAIRSFRIGALSVLKEINQRLTAKTDAFGVLDIIGEINQRI